MNPVYLGIDVSKKSLDLANANRYLGRFDNTPTGHRQLLKYIRALSPTLVALEATGGYERPVTEMLLDADIPVAVVQPKCVRHFAQSLKLLAKTDAIDAQLIARFAKATEPTAAVKADPDAVRLRALRDRRQQIVEDRVREQNRLESCADRQIQAELRRSIKRLARIEAQLDEQIDQCIQASAKLHAKAQVLQQSKGVGRQVAATLLAHLPELGTVNRQQIAALAGLAPYARESGRWRGQRTIFGGRAEVRRMLYLAAISAARWDPVLRPFYRKLLEAGKLKKVALVAVARKLLIRLNSTLAKLDLPNPSPTRAATT